MVIIIYVQILFSLVLAETTINVPSLSKKKDTTGYALPLTAENFLDPLTDENRNKRPKTWPEKLTFSEPLSMSAEEALKKMQGEFRVVYHCDGNAVEASSSKIIFDGYFNESMNFEVKENKYTRKLFPPNKRSLSPPAIDKICEIKIQRSENSANQFNMHFVRCDDGNSFNSNAIKVKRVIETGEIIFESSGTSAECPDGKRMKSIYVPSGTLLISKI